MVLEFKDNGIGALISIFVLAVLGISFVAIIANSLTSMDDVNVLTDEAITISAAGLIETANKPLQSIQHIFNTTGTQVVDLTAADFNFTTQGLLNGELHVNASFASMANMFINYTYQPATYVEDTISRNILNATILIFFVVGLLLGVIGWFYRGQVKEFLGK